MFATAANCCVSSEFHKEPHGCLPCIAAQPAACAGWCEECGDGCAQTVHQARYEHAHGSRLGKPAEDRVLPDVKAMRRSAAGEASTSGRDAPADQARFSPS